MKNPEVKISVIIPAYNRVSLIGETLQSLLNQTLPAKEIIVVDDGSTDDTARVVERIAEELEVRRSEIDDKQGAGSSEQGALDSRHSVLDSQPAAKPRLRVIRQANAGPGAARNRGLAEATGEFIHFFDSDDIAAPNKHEVQLRALLETGADIAYGPWVKGRFAPEDARNLASGELSVASLNSDNTRYQLPATLYSGFIPEGPVLQAKGLPEGSLIRALLTNWSIVPHACLFRRSILEKAGGFPEDIWVGEDQLLFFRCLLAGAKVVHTPNTMVFYRLGDDPGKLTAKGAAQKRHARDWARFLLKANKEVTSAGKRVPAEAQRRRDFLSTDDSDIHGYQKSQPSDAQGICAGAAFSNPSTSELSRASQNTSPTRSASGPAVALRVGKFVGDRGNQLADSMKFLEGQSQAGLQMENKRDHTIRSANDLVASRKQSDENPVNFVNPVKNCFGFRLRAYEAWRDLEKFFPGEESELKIELQGIWKRNPFSVFSFQFAGFVFRKWGGVKLRVLGYRENASFRCGKFSSFIDFSDN